MKIDFSEFKKEYEVFRRCDVEHYSYVKSIFIVLCDIISSSSDRGWWCTDLPQIARPPRQPQSRQFVSSPINRAKLARQLLHRVMPIDLDDSWITKYYLMGDVDFS